MAGKMVHQLIMRTQDALTHLAEEGASSLLVLTDVVHQVFVPVAIEATCLTLERALMDHSRDMLKHEVLSSGVAE